MHVPTAQICNEEPDTTQVPAKLRICGPDDASLLIEPYQNGYVRIGNGSLHAIPELRLEVASAQSFDAPRRAFRDRTHNA